MKVSSQSIIGAIVAGNLNTATIFEKYGIDYCCNGYLTLKEACDKFNADYATIIKELILRCSKSDSLSVEIDKMTLNELITHIVEIHHNYLKSAIPILKNHISKIVEVHAGKHSELYKISELFTVLEKDILDHLDKEEKVLYPYINDLVSKSKNKAKDFTHPLNKIKAKVKELEGEHEAVGVIIDSIHKITERYKIPYDACNTFRLIFKELEDDLRIHIVKENQILHPKAIKLEKSLFNQ